MEFRSLVAEIEAYLKELLRSSSQGWIEVRRKDIAELFDCVPSQVTYVVNTRFTDRQGYLVESRRGGGGFIRIWNLWAAPERPSGRREGPGGNQKRNDPRLMLKSLMQQVVLTPREFQLINATFRMLEESLPDRLQEECKLKLIKEILADGGFI